MSIRNQVIFHNETPVFSAFVWSGGVEIVINETVEISFHGMEPAALAAKLRAFATELDVTYQPVSAPLSAPKGG